jgi:hypothetical protein
MNTVNTLVNPKNAFTIGIHSGVFGVRLSVMHLLNAAKNDVLFLSSWLARNLLLLHDPLELIGSGLRLCK